MRTTKALLLCAAAVAAGAVSAMAQSSNVYSMNVVGYVNLTCTNGGKYTCLANPLNAPTNTIASLIGTNLPLNGKVMKWNVTLNKFDSWTRVSYGNGWSPTTATNVTLNPGEGFFVQTPPASSTPITFTFVGDVLQGSLTNSLPSGYWLTGNLVPDSGSLTNLGLTVPYSASPQNKIMKWNIPLQKWDSFTRVSYGTGWSPSAPSVNPGDGFFSVMSAPNTWVRNFTVQ